MRGGTHNQRSVKRFRSPGLDDTASPGEYSSEVCKHFQGIRESKCCIEWQLGYFLCWGFKS